jgi:hypothetical protein
VRKDLAQPVAVTDVELDVDAARILVGSPGWKHVNRKDCLALGFDKVPNQWAADKSATAGHQDRFGFVRWLK